jgi:hypothetical protein
MIRVGMELADAMALVKRRRPVAEPIPAFVAMLERYEKTCKQAAAIHSSSIDTTPSGPMPSRGSNPKRKRAIGPAMGPVAADESRDSCASGIIGPSDGGERQEKKPRARVIGPERPKAPNDQGLDSVGTGQAFGPRLGPNRPKETSPSTEETSSKDLQTE